MRIPKTAGLIGLFLFALVCVPSVLACGKERWPVKTITDNHAKYFFKDRDISGGELVAAMNTTVSKLAGQPWPFDWSPGAAPQQWSYTYRAGQAEFTLWKLNARIMEKKNEDDEDYHLVLQSGSKQMIGEIPSPNCVEGTPEPIKGMILQARQDFDAWYSQQPSPKKEMNKKITLIGIGFFDRVHGGTGQQANGIELHPVISVSFPD